MTSLNQIQQEIQALPQEALEMLIEYIQILKNMTFTSIPREDTLQKVAAPLPSGNVYEKFQASGLIGCISVEEDLSVTYKEVLAQEWERKYDHR